MIRQQDLEKRLNAILQLDSRLPVTADLAAQIVKTLAPFVIAMYKEELADAHREWLKRERQG